jgi:hypothetical protein
MHIPPSSNPKPPKREEQLTLFADLDATDVVVGSSAAQAEAINALRRAHASLQKLWEIDRAAARLLIDAPNVPLSGRCALELARFHSAARGLKGGFRNSLAQAAQRRWKAAGLPVTVLRRSSSLDLVDDGAWRTLSIAPELAVAALSLSKGPRSR